MWYPCKWLALYCGMRTCTWIAVVVKYIVVHRIAPAPNAPPAGRGPAPSVLFFLARHAIEQTGTSTGVLLKTRCCQMQTDGLVA